MFQWKVNFLKLMTFILILAVGTVELGLSSNWYKTIFHIATESHENWNPEREDFPAGFAVGAHHHHSKSDHEDCSDPKSTHSPDSHLLELVSSILVSVAPQLTSVNALFSPIQERDVSLIDQSLTAQDPISNLFRPPIA